MTDNYANNTRLDLNLTLKCDVFCCQSVRALSLPLHKRVSRVVGDKPKHQCCGGVSRELARVR